MSWASVLTMPAGFALVPRSCTRSGSRAGEASLVSAVCRSRRERRAVLTPSATSLPL